MAGRPTLYDPRYCAEVIEVMKTGLSKTAFAGSIGVCRDTVIEWEKQHPEFSDAVKVAQASRTMTLERDMLDAMEGPRVTSRIFALKNAAPDEWRDKREFEHSGDLNLSGRIQRARLAADGNAG